MRRCPEMRVPPSTRSSPVALVVVLLGVVALLTAACGPTSRMATPPATATATATAPSWLAYYVIAPGWSPALALGPLAAPYQLVAAPGNPSTLYACGWDLAAMRVGVSRDGGATWRIATPVSKDVPCALSVSPVDPQAALLVLNGDFSSRGPAQVFRTADGGATWTAQQVPAGLPAQGYANPGWAGATALVAYQGFDDTRVPTTTALIASSGGQPFTRLDANGMLGSVRLGMVRFITGDAQRVVLAYWEPESGVPASSLVVGQPGGGGWSVVPLRAGGRGVVPVAFAAQGRVLAGPFESGAAGLAVSTDGGTSWRALLPPGAATAYDPKRLQLTPDGTLCVQVRSATGQAGSIYAVPAGQTAWKMLVDLPTNALPGLVTWDAGGAPNAYWAGLAERAQRADVNPLLARHQL